MLHKTTGFPLRDKDKLICKWCILHRVVVMSCKIMFLLWCDYYYMIYIFIFHLLELIWICRQLYTGWWMVACSTKPAYNFIAIPRPLKPYNGFYSRYHRQNQSNTLEINFTILICLKCMSDLKLLDITIKVYSDSVLVSEY